MHARLLGLLKKYQETEMGSVEKRLLTGVWEENIHKIELIATGNDVLGDCFMHYQDGVKKALEVVQGGNNANE